MPTYDELIGRDGITDENYNARLLTYANPQGLNVLTIHAEVEGIACASMLDEFIVRSRDSGYDFVPLGQLPELRGNATRDALAMAPLHGREGEVAWQRSAVSS